MNQQMPAWPSPAFSFPVFVDPSFILHPSSLSQGSTREEQLIDLIRRDFGRCRRGPRRDGFLVRRIKRLHGFPDRVYAVREQVADQEVGDESLQLREGADELAEAKAVVV